MDLGNRPGEMKRRSSRSSTNAQPLNQFAAGTRPKIIRRQNGASQGGVGFGTMPCYSPLTKKHSDRASPLPNTKASRNIAAVYCKISYCRAGIVLYAVFTLGTQNVFSVKMRRLRALGGLLRS